MDGEAGTRMAARCVSALQSWDIMLSGATLATHIKQVSTAVLHRHTTQSR